MSKKTQITEEQLKELQQKVSNIQQFQSQIGGVEAQKHILLHQLLAAQEDLQKMQTALKDEYGDVTINIQTGAIEEEVK